jgi:hypothetical protein
MRKLLRWPRYSVRTLLWAMTLLALGIVGWQQFLYVHPAHRVSLYEKAQYTSGRSIQVGPNEIGMKLLTRNDRDGSLTSTDGRGVVIKNAQPQNAAVLTNCAPWLDVVQLELTTPAELLDIARLRIFDHATRTLLSDDNPRYGWRVVSQNVIQIFGLGVLLPDKLDIWFDVKSYESPEIIATLVPQAGASCDLETGKLSIYSLREGSWGGDSRTHFDYLLSRELNKSTVVFDFAPKWTPNPATKRSSGYQLLTVSESGERLPSDGSFAHPYPMAHPVVTDIDYLYVARDEIERFEIRTNCDNEKFFFEGVSLPSTIRAPFTLSPNVIFKVGGEEVNKNVPEFAPLEVRLQTWNGDTSIVGSIGGDGFVDLIAGEDEKPGSGSFTTISVTRNGIRERMQVMPSLERGFQLGPGNARNHWAGSSNRAIEASQQPFALKGLKNIRLTFPPPPKPAKQRAIPTPK